MGLRILTGVLVPLAGLTVGGPHTATINFNPHGVSGDAHGMELTSRGDNGEFDFEPGKVVSVRQHSGAGPITIDDSDPTTESMDVRWTAGGGATIEEISYMIVGEA